jgi:hypothetical protein
MNVLFKTKCLSSKSQPVKGQCAWYVAYRHVEFERTGEVGNLNYPEGCKQIVVYATIWNEPLFNQQRNHYH